MVSRFVLSALACSGPLLAPIVAASPVAAFDPSPSDAPPSKSIDVGDLTVQGAVRKRVPAATIFSGNGAGIDVQFGPNGETSARPGGQPQFDAIRSMVTVDGKQGVGQVSAVAGTVRGRVRAGGSNNNGFPVGGFFNATCEVDGCNVWSLNTTASDSGDNTVDPRATGRVIQNEFDMNVWNATTVAKGLSAVLNAFTPGVTSTFAFIAEKNTHSPPWAAGFMTGSGAAQSALVAGEAAKSGTNVPSQPIVFNYFDGAGANNSVRLSVLPGPAGTRLAQTGGAGFQAANLFLPNGGQIQAANGSRGTPITIAATDDANRLTLGLNAFQVVLPSQLVPPAANTQAVGTPVTPFGSVAAAAYYAGKTAGVSCSGPPTANFTVVNGIVTRC